MVYIRDDNRKAFIDEERINTLLEETKNPEKERVEDIIAKSLSKQRLELEEMAVLLNCEDESAMANRILYHPANLIMYHIERRSSFLSLFI